MDRKHYTPFRLACFSFFVTIAIPASMAAEGEIKTSLMDLISAACDGRVLIQTDDGEFRPRLDSALCPHPQSTEARGPG